MKRCSKCGETKPLSGFYTRKNGSVVTPCVKCMNSTSKQWRGNNKEKLQEYNHNYKKSWYAENTEKAREQSREWGRNNLQRVLDKVKQWVSQNPEKKREQNKSWRLAHPDKVSESRKRWEAANPDKVLEKSRNRRAKKKSNGGKITAAEWREVLERYNHTCLCCREKGKKLTMDHVLPLALGGTHTADNVQPLCVSCNSKKQARHVDYRS